MLGSGLTDAAALLTCPVCALRLHVTKGALACEHGHSFDIAKQGYVNLETGGKHAADTSEMVAARAAFLNAGHFAPIAEGVRAAATPVTARSSTPWLVDLAGGTGYYAAHVADRAAGARGIVVELSKFALRRAAKASMRVAAVGADVWSGIPIATNAADVVLSVFGPRNPAEIERLLAPGGVLVVVAPTNRHLARLRRTFGLLDVDPRKDDRLADQLENFELIDRSGIEYPLALSRDDTVNAVLMGPNGFHICPDSIRSTVASLPNRFADTASVRIRTYGVAK